MDRQQTIDTMSDSFGRLKRAMHTYATIHYADLGLSPAQLGTLRAVKASQPINHGSLAQYCQMTPGAISQLIEALDAANCINRSSSKTDRRVSYLSVSQHGEDELRRYDARRRELLQQAVSNVSDADLQIYAQVQMAIADWLEQSTKQ